jgi:hypothetical protein
MIWILPLLLFLYPIELFDLPVPPRAAPTGSGQLISRSALSPQPRPPAKQQFPLRPTPKLERKVFLLAFERQAGDQLIGCLRSNVGEKGHVSFVARLNKAGQLSGVRLLEAKYASLDCALSAVKAMAFADVAASLSSDIEIAWRFDW